MYWYSYKFAISAPTYNEICYSSTPRLPEPSDLLNQPNRSSHRRGTRILENLPSCLDPRDIALPCKHELDTQDGGNRWEASTDVLYAVAKVFGKPAGAMSRGGARREVKLARIARGWYTYLHEDEPSTLKSVLLAARTTARTYLHVKPNTPKWSRAGPAWFERTEGSRWKWEAGYVRRSKRETKGCTQA